MKLLVVVLLILLGAYWMFVHYDPMPLNHEQLGLFSHDVHRLIGVVFFVLAAVVQWKWKRVA